MTDYEKYRGRCKELSEAAVKADPTLRLVRGFYCCPMWNREEQHWWTVLQDGTIYDPSARQFPSKGLGSYREYDGTLSCANCGKEFQEGAEGSSYTSRFAFCSYECHGQFVGVF